MKTPKDQAVLGVWFSSPLSHFHELGTVKTAGAPVPDAGAGAERRRRWALRPKAIAARAARQAARAARKLRCGMTLADPTGRIAR